MLLFAASILRLVNVCVCLSVCVSLSISVMCVCHQEKVTHKLSNIFYQKNYCIYTFSEAQRKSEKYVTTQPTSRSPSRASQQSSGQPLMKYLLGASSAPRRGTSDRF